MTVSSILRTCIVLTILSLAAVPMVSAQGTTVYLIEIKEEIDAGVSRRVAQSLKDAEAAGADAIIIEINTFGGRLDASVELRDAILNSKIQIIAYVNKRAISAGALLSLAADKIVMAPGATIGASTPTTFLGTRASEKIISYWRAEMRATAETSNRPVEIADAMVDEIVEIPGLIEKGKLLTLTTKEALKHNLADYQSENIVDLLNQTGLAGAQIVRELPTPGFLDEWGSPAIIWFTIGLVLVLLEFVIPGLITIFFGIGAWIVSAICVFFEISLNVQLLIFLVSSIFLVLALRNHLKSFFGDSNTLGQIEAEDRAAFIGKKAVVTKDITPHVNGRVEFRGTYWDAEANETIPKGSSVEILDKKKLTLTVSPL